MSGTLECCDLEGKFSSHQYGFQIRHVHFLEKKFNFSLLEYVSNPHYILCLAGSADVTVPGLFLTLKGMEQLPSVVSVQALSKSGSTPTEFVV